MCVKIFDSGMRYDVIGTDTGSAARRGVPSVKGVSFTAGNGKLAVASVLDNVFKRTVDASAVGVEFKGACVHRGHCLRFVLSLGKTHRTQDYIISVLYGNSVCREEESEVEAVEPSGKGGVRAGIKGIKLVSAVIVCVVEADEGILTDALS